MSNDLEPIEPRTAKEMYLDDRRHVVADATLQAHDYRLKQFVQWCEAKGIENLNNFSGRDIHRFRVKRREEDDLATATMKGKLVTLRMFMRFCASIDAVEPGLDEKILLPTTTEEDACDEMLGPGRAQQVIEHLEQYQYASLEHALIEVLRFMVDEVLVSGTIWGNNSCYTARLGEVVIDDSLLLVCVESYEDRGEDELCMEADYGIDYEAVFKFDGELPTTVTVEYNGQEITSEQRK